MSKVSVTISKETKVKQTPVSFTEASSTLAVLAWVNASAYDNHAI